MINQIMKKSELTAHLEEDFKQNWKCRLSGALLSCDRTIFTIMVYPRITNKILEENLNLSDWL